MTARKRYDSQLEAEKRRNEKYTTISVRLNKDEIAILDRERAKSDPPEARQGWVAKKVRAMLARRRK